MASEDTLSPMKTFTKDNSCKETDSAKENILGRTVAFTRANGRETR